MLVEFDDSRIVMLTVVQSITSTDNMSVYLPQCAVLYESVTSLSPLMKM